MQRKLFDKINISNCWKPLKTTKPQHNSEIYISVMVTKVKRICCMVYG
nr:MAG TPA: hypothetical protein [Caudoviricetes sp.]DAV02965.1 MAG TPA: hypothetical protein [Bacteriophage sp.]